jgi:hypothetical protein
LEIILNKSECLRIAYEMKEEFREIYETKMTVTIAQTEFKDWLNYAQIFSKNQLLQLLIILKEFVITFLNQVEWMSGINNRN